MWILILTLITTNGTTMATAPGFKSLKACQVAADLWVQQQDNRIRQPYALCVQQ